jgi:hypothetical protein
VNPDCVIGFLQIKRNHAGVFVKVVAIGNIIRNPGKLGDGGVFFTESELYAWQKLLVDMLLID